jgi:hypothetical protein
MTIVGDIEIIVPWRLSWSRPVLSRSWGHLYRRAMSGVVFECPCCFCPTLKTREWLQNCLLCWWTDGGQDDARADEVWGGANGRYSLTEARENFREHMLFMRPHEGAYKMLQSAPEAKKEIVAAFEAMRQTTDREEIDRLWQQALTAADQVERLGEYYRELLRHAPDFHD